VERCAALMEGDIVYVTFKIPKSLSYGNSGTNSHKSKKKASGEVIDLESTMIGAYETNRECRDGRY
jgi:hypothetical protein